MSLIEHAKRELEYSGLGDEYGGMTGNAVLELMEVFSNQGHSGFSAHQVRGIFNELAQFKPLGPLTSNPDEWMHIEDDVAGDAITWQNRRRPDAFSKDGGKTYYLVDDQRTKPRMIARKVGFKIYPLKTNRYKAEPHGKAS